MNYDKHKDMDKYRDILDIKTSQLRRFDVKKAGVLFFDGKNATKHHNREMLDGEFTRQLLFSIRILLNRYHIREYYLYAFLDEITIIIPDMGSLSRRMEEDNADCLLSLFAIKLYKEFSKYEECAFKGCYYEIEKNRINDLIEFRKMCAQLTTAEYYAKEYCESAEYSDKDYDQIIDLLKTKGLYEGYMSNEKFSMGLYYDYVE